MADLKITQLPNAATPLGDPEILPLVQSGVTSKVTWANIKATLLAWLQSTVLPAPGPIGGTTRDVGSFTRIATGTSGIPAWVPTAANSKVLVQGDDNAGSNMILSISTNSGPAALFQKSRGTLAVPTPVIAGDYLGAFDFYGYDGTNGIMSAQIKTVVSGTVSAGVVPTYLGFMTRNAAGVLGDRMILGSEGDLGLGVTPNGGPKLQFPISGDIYIGKRTSSSHQAGNASRVDLAIDDGGGYSGVSVRNVWDGTYSSQEIVMSTAYGGTRLVANIFKVDKFGNALVIAPYGGLGYGTGAGGTVTQATSKTTGVTLNKPVGQITFNNAALAADATATFQFTNSLIAANDVVSMVIKSPVSGLANYNLWCGDIGAGYCWVTLKNISAGSLSDAVVINFALIKGVAA